MHPRSDLNAEVWPGTCAPRLQDVEVDEGEVGAAVALEA